MSIHSFKHSGNLADIIYSLPALKALGGGVLYLDTNGGHPRFNSTAYDTIRPLLLEQEYIHDVRVWNNEPIDFDLDSARAPATDPKMNLAAMYLRKFGLDEQVLDRPWLTIKSEPIKLHKEIIINRTARRQAKYQMLEVTKWYWLPKSIFIGLPIEHEWFEHTFDCKIEHYPTRDALEIARILKGAAKLMANQSLVMSIAIGLDVPFMQEVYDLAPNCQFRRQGSVYF
jgi:hypothetical protein